MIDFSLKRIFVIGDTSTGKTTSTINQVLENGVPIVYYVTSKKIDLNDKEEYVRTKTFGKYKYDTLYHDSDKIISLNKKSTHKFHLMTIEKALYYFLNNELEDGAIMILDEIDAISQNKNYELLVGLLNTKYPNNLMIYISATINKDYLINRLSKFFMLDTSNPNSVIDRGKFERHVSTEFLNSKNYKKDVIKAIQTYCDNPEKFGQTIFLIPSKPYIRKILDTDIMKNYVFRQPNVQIREYLKKVPKEYPLSPNVILALRHNIGLIDALSKHEDRELILKLFNEGKINVLLATNVIERGINIVANSIFIFESRNVQWDDNQILNMFGRLNRSIGGKTTNRLGYFFLISETRNSYHFEKIYDRNYIIRSILKYKDVYFFYINYPDIINHLISLYDAKNFYATNQYKKYADCIRYSLTIDDIRSISKELDLILNKDLSTVGTTNERQINLIVTKVGSERKLFNVMKYIYKKLYDNFYSGKITKDLYINKVNSLIYEYVNKGIKFAITSLYGKNLIKEELRISEGLVKGTYTINNAPSIFVFKHQTA